MNGTIILIVLLCHIRPRNILYVVERKKPDPICFGSGVIRNTNLIGKGLSPFQKRYAFEINPTVSPQSYDLQHLISGVEQLNTKVCSNKGMSSLASTTVRFPQGHFRVPSPTRYNIESKRKIKPMKVPFGNSLPLGIDPPMRSPGPGTYTLSDKCCRRTKTNYNFGNPELVLAVETLCIPVETDRCERCNIICKEDYWHKNWNRYLCHFCMEEEKILHEDYTQKELKQFQKIRTCSYKHSHEGTTAKIQLMPTNKIKKIEQLESYLSLYISSF